MKQLHFSIRTLILLIIALLNILIAGPLGYLTYKSWTNYQNAIEIRHVSKAINYLYETEKYLSLERASAMSLLFVSGPVFKDLHTEMQESRLSSRDNLDKAFSLISQEKDPKVLAALGDVRKSYSNLQILRLRLDTMTRTPSSNRSESLSEEYFQTVTSLVDHINQLIDFYLHPVLLHNPEIIRQMRVTHLIWGISEYAGREYAILGSLIAQNKFPDHETREHLMILRARIIYGLELAHGATQNSRWKEEVAPALEEAETHYGTIFNELKEIIYQPVAATSTLYPITVEMWLQLASEAVSSLYEMTDTVLRINNQYIEDMEVYAKRAIYLSLFFFISALILSFLSWRLITTRIIKPVNSMIEALYKETSFSDRQISESDHVDEITKLKLVLKAFQDNSRQLQKERDKAQAASVAKGEFLTNMSHEIRTPMNVVVGLSSILSRSQPLSEKQAEYIKTLQVSADSLLGLINDLLDFSKIEAQNFELEKVPFDLDKLIKDLALIKTFKAKEKGLSFISDVENIQGKTYIGDSTRIRQILVNLCGNAIKFTDTGSIVLAVKTRTHKTPGYECIDISVTDTGIGIPPDKIDMIFEKFTQADASIVRKYGGTGLGLAITKNLVDMMDGTIKVESIPGKGTSFYVSIPLILKAQQNLFIVDDSEKHDHMDTQKDQGKVLLVEDYRPNALVAGTFLEEFGYQYDVAETGQEAVQKYMEEDYDAVLMDIQMPGMDGYQATKAIRKYEEEKGGKRAKIIGLTAHASIRDQQRCLDSGMDDYLFKPFEQKKLKEKLQA